MATSSPDDIFGSATTVQARLGGCVPHGHPAGGGCGVPLEGIGGLQPAALLATFYVYGRGSACIKVSGLMPDDPPLPAVCTAPCRRRLAPRTQRRST
jgi:hypothetical protein